MNILSQIRTLKIVQNMPKWLISLRVCVESGPDLHFAAIWQKYEYFKSDKNLKKMSKIFKKWLMNVSEELDTKSAKLDTATSLNKF